MAKFPQNMRGGFDIAVLTYKIAGEALVAKASPFSETPKKERLFLISIEEPPKPIPVIDKYMVGGSHKIKRTTNRKRIIFGDTFFYGGKIYPVNSAKSGLYAEVLIKLIEQFEIAKTKWRRVFVLRFDLHMHVHRKDNQSQTAFRKRLFQRLRRAYGLTDIGYSWVREHERAKTQHYHWVLFLDGDLIRHSKKINQMIKQAWEQPCGNYYVPVINRPFYFVDSEAVAEKAIYRISYLAKPRGKGYRDKQTKDYQCSRMKL